jgi:3-oxoacyl-[acyl-carrier-protein] synthase III
VAVGGIGIGAIGVILGSATEATAGRAPGLGIERERLEQRLGFAGLAVKRADQDTSDLALAAVEALGPALDPDTLDCLCVVTQTPDGGGIPPVSSILHGRLKLSARVAAFDVAHGCAGFVYGLMLSLSFMQAQGFRRGLLVTSDPYSKIVDREDPHTALIFGDAATATLLQPDPAWSVGRADFGSAGDQRDALRLLPNGRLYMNGKRIARLCHRVVPESVRRTLELNGLSLEQIDQVLLHQGSRYIVETVGQALGVPEKTPFVAAAYGNVVSSSLPVALARHVAPGVKRLVISGFGVGLSWATTVLTRNSAG